MAGRNGQELLGTWVSTEVAAQFKAHARKTEGGVSAELRRLVMQAVSASAPAQPAGGSGYRVMVRLKDGERQLLLRAARERSTTPANWLRSLALAHLERRPQWSIAELDVVRDVFLELRRIGNNVNQIARALNAAALAGEAPRDEGRLAKEAVEAVSKEVRRVGALVAANVAYWGVPRSGRSGVVAQAGEADN